ncbi:helix-turn-helix transcriptional regulator [Microbacterium sp.]|uniref:helix-turn-helix domain-containing protein n=1 Tax=Microbacterium sp. TaxID=51671 RepID=UPI0028AA074F|nr:helix-turn-helix transcriptional regulator [Microbacterium sp.]
MEIEEALYFFRKNKGLKQKEILHYTDSSVYSRIENGKKFLKYSELRTILKNLSVPLVEFSEYLDDDLEQKKFRQLMREYNASPTSSEVKQKLVDYYSAITFSSSLDSALMSNYIGLKLLFYPSWKEIDPIKQSELNVIFNLLNDKEYFFQYDYALLAHTIFLFDKKKRKQLATKALPIKNIHLRNTATKEFIKNMLNNLITTFLREEEYEQSLYYLSLESSQSEDSHDLSYIIVLNYLTNLTKYLMTKEPIYKQKIEETINYLNSIGETKFASSIEREVTALIKGERDIPIFIQAGL